MQTGYTLIRRRVLRRLIRVYTVCQCPIYGTLGLNGLKLKPIIITPEITVLLTSFRKSFVFWLTFYTEEVNLQTFIIV